MKVLLIEDDESSAELLTMRLNALGCEVHATADAHQAMDMAHSLRDLDLVITDLKLAHDAGSGIELVRQLREDPETADLPIVVHSVFVAFPSDAPEALPEVDGYLPKPFKFEVLKQLVSRFG